MIFDGNWFYKRLTQILIGVYLDALIRMHICKAISDVFDLAETTFRQKTLKKNTSQMVYIYSNSRFKLSQFVCGKVSLIFNVSVYRKIKKKIVD